jgi:DNA helicase-2/ATP-dependent DNA helicase PcrA
VTLVPTPEQQAVADYPLRPLRVTAGAGTGKTTTMALRLASLIRREGIAPEEALGITFTNKAAEELADRLRLHLPELADAGRQVEVNTYHGFAYGLLAEFGSLVGVERGAGVITPGYTRQLLREALGAAPRRALDLTSPGARVGELGALAGRLGDHLCRPADLIADDPGDEVALTRDEMAEVLGGYAERKRQLGLVDYADMIALGHRLLAEHPEVAERLRARYRVVLLDEYQDTNPAQREVLRRLFGAGFPVTAVGDPDQTIYEWRGASLENFAAFPIHFPEADGTPAATLALSHNRRSGQRIIALANLVRGQIEGSGGLDRLQALDEAPPAELETAWLQSALDEASWIARRLAEWHEAGEIEWRDAGILFRRHRDIGLVREALEQQGIPVEVAALGGLLEVPEVADLHAWLSIIGRPDDDASLMRVLLGSRYRLGLGDLAPAAGWRGAGRSRLHDDEAGPRRALLEAFDHLEEIPGFSPEAERRLRAFRGTYRRLLEPAQGLSLSALCRRVLDETGAWPEVEALDDAARLSARLNLYRFLDLAEAWSPLEGAPSLDAFLDYLDLLLEEGADDELDTARLSGEDAVVLLTVHRAKGLEWPLVVLPALLKGVFPGGAHVLEDPTAHAQFLPDHLRLDRDWLPALPEDPDERKETLQERHRNQEWRTAYVAVTRAKTRLLLTGAYWYGGKLPRERSPLFDLAQNVEGAVHHAPAAEAGEPPPTLRLDPGPGEPDPLFRDGWLAALRQAVADPAYPRQLAREKRAARAFHAAAAELAALLAGLPAPLPEVEGKIPFRTSVTALVTFASCPLRFHWSAVDRLPRRPAPQLRHGIELHRRIELHQRSGLPIEEAGEALYDLPADQGQRSRSDPFAAFLASRFAARSPILVEAPFELAVGDARVAGRIDAVYADAHGGWEVVDFKSGSPRSDPARRVQLEAYAVAVADAGLADPPPPRTRVTFAYLGGRQPREVSADVDAAWLGTARRRLSDLTARAASGERHPAPSPACRNCDFARFCPEGCAWLADHPG